MTFGWRMNSYRDSQRSTTLIDEPRQKFADEPQFQGILPCFHRRADARLKLIPLLRKDIVA